MGEAASVAAAHDVYTRLLCHILVDRLPDNALPDLVQHIFLVWEDAAARAWTRVQPESPARRVIAKSVKRYDRQTFPVED
jgi:hypothetical protein